MLKTLLAVARVNFLSLTLVCVGVAATAAWQAGTPLNIPHLALIFIMALCAHISVNAFNEFFDFRSGLDFLTQRTPFSGGSGELVARPNGIYLALTLAIVTIVAVVGIGIYFAWQIGWSLLWIGLPGVILIYTYTQHINRWPLACLLAPGVGFGLMMTLGAFWVLHGQVTAGALSLALILTLVVSDLLLLNQFPDVTADTQVGRRHFPIVIGRQHSAKLFALLWIASYGILLAAILQYWLPIQTLLALASIPLLIKMLIGVLRHADEPQLLIPYMALNVLLCHIYPLLLIAGLVWSRLTL